MAGKSTIRQTGGNIMENKPLLIGGGVVALILIVVLVLFLMKRGPFAPDGTPAPDDE
jgi:hypothetical protein